MNRCHKNKSKTVGVDQAVLTREKYEENYPAGEAKIELSCFMFTIYSFGLLQAVSPLQSL